MAQEKKKSVGRRGFLVGLLTGGGVAAALGAAPPRATAKKEPPPDERLTAGPILYRRTEEAERYYRTLYR